MLIIKSKLKNNLVISLLTLFAIVAGFNTMNADFNKIKYEKEVLENGLEVIYHLDKSAPIVATVIHYRVGSSDEVVGQTGYAHFFEHLMFEATDNIPRATMDKHVLDAGGNLNAFTAFDQTVFHFKVPSNEIKLPLFIESQRMRKLHVDSIGVETQRGVVLEELKQRTENRAYGSLLQKMMENLFPGSGYGWSVIGLAKDIEKATIKNFQDFYKNFYQPNNATLVIAGDFKIADAKEYARAYFGQYPKAEAPKRNKFELKDLEKGYEETIVDDKVQLPGVFLGFRGPAISHEDYFAVSMLTKVLAVGESSRFYRRLVSKEQIALQTAAVPIVLQKSGLMLVYGICSPGNTPDDVKDMLLDEIDKVIEDGITEAELQKVKNITEVEFVEDKKDLMGKAQALAQYNSIYNNPDLINTEIDHFLDVTQEDIKRVAKKYFGSDKKVVLIYVPKGS
ncbi:MAG: pitrilysin family protein [Candidatus Kapabacteria bacterium]|jgi:zinc protease|nr:pitrilysin family protein [Candidatus Kapabacteria bacterium]